MQNQRNYSVNSQPLCPQKMACFFIPRTGNPRSFSEFNVLRLEKNTGRIQSNIPYRNRFTA